MVRRWLEKAARRIPNIAPRVPPILSIIGRRLLRSIGTEPLDVVQTFVSRVFRIAGARLDLGIGRIINGFSKQIKAILPWQTSLTPSPQSPSPIMVSHFVRFGSASIALLQACRIAASRRLGSTIYFLLIPIQIALAPRTRTIRNILPLKSSFSETVPSCSTSALW